MAIFVDVDTADYGYEAHLSAGSILYFQSALMNLMRTPLMMTMTEPRASPSTCRNTALMFNCAPLTTHIHTVQPDHTHLLSQQVFSARCNIYISCLCYDVSVCLSVCLWSWYMPGRGEGSSPGIVEGSSRAMLATARLSCINYYMSLIPLSLLDMFGNELSILIALFSL